MKLFVVVVQQQDSDGLADSMLASAISFTRIDSAGGFLQQGNVTFLVGIDDAKIGDLLALVKHGATTRVQMVSPVPAMIEPGELAVPYPVEVQVGGATIFGFDVERFERL
jgi:uncharacterized protein YaaQ